MHLRFYGFFIYRGNKIYEPPRYMTVAQAASQLLEIVANQRANGNSDPGEICVVMSQNIEARTDKGTDHWGHLEISVWMSKT